MIFSDLLSHWTASGYNYFFEVAALLFLLILAIKHFSQKRFPSILTKFFITSLIVAILDVSVDIIASVLVEKYMHTCPLWINHFFNGAFYILQIALLSLLFIYVLILLGPAFYRKKLTYLFLIPTLIYVVFTFLNLIPGSNLIFYFEGDNYCHGPLFLSYYGIAIYYLLLIAIFSIIFRKRIGKRHLIAIFTSISLIIAGIIVQICLPLILLTGITTTAALYFIENNISNPDDMIDKITGVFNFTALNLYLEKNANSKKENFIISIDVEKTEPINETLGIVVGNKLYSQIGQFFNSLQKDMFAFRIFSSKFVLIFKTKQDAENAVGAITHRFEKPWKVKDSEFMLSCTVVQFSDNGKHETCNQFLNYTNLLIEKSKKQLDDNVLYVNSEEIEKITRELKIENILTEQLSGDCKGFSMRYQPILNAKTNKFSNAEALLRFTCEEYGNIPPAEFVPLAEKAGLATLLDEYVLRTVCAFLNKHPEIKMMEVNVSGAEFFANPASKFVDIIKKSKVDPKRICFEITETATIKHPEHINEFMTILKKEGVCFAIDDFGTGYSNVSQLLTLPFDIIKLDKTLLEDSDKTRKFVIAMKDLFKSLNYPLVIEGVETKELYDFAKTLGFEYIQGYYFAKCLTEEEYLDFIAKNN